MEIERTPEAAPHLDEIGYRVDDLIIDVPRQRVTRDNEEIALAPLSYELLLALLRAAPNLVSLNELMKRVWPGVVVGPETVSQRVKLVRQALGDNAVSPRYIAGVRGRGYRLIAAVKALEPVDPAGENGTADLASELPSIGSAVLPGAQPMQQEEAPQRMNRTIVVVLALAIVGFGFGQFVLAPHRDGMPVAPVQSQSAASNTAKPAIAANDPSIAVLPFVDISKSGDQEYFSDGLSEELLNQLARIPQLRVIARTSSFSFRNKEVDVATIAKALNVSHILEGSVRKSGNKLRITVQLIRASDSSHLWLQTYDREITDVFKVQDEIAGEVVAALKIEMLASQQVTHTQRTHSTEAYEQYLLGMHDLRNTGPEATQRALVALGRAIELDPQYANAYSALATAQRFSAAYADGPAQRAEVIGQAFATIEKAIALAPDLPDGYAVRGSLRYHLDWDWQGARADFKQALTLDPNNAATLPRYANALFFGGHRQEAIAMDRKATVIDPLSPVAWTFLGLHLSFDGQVSDARSAFEHALDLNPNGNWPSYLMGVLELRAGNTDTALTYFRRGPEYFRLAGGAMVEHSRGNTQASQQALDEMESKYAVGYAYQLAQVHAWRGEKDLAFEWLNRAYDIHDAGMVRMRYDPILENLHDEPRFAALVKKMGFPK